MAKIVGGIDEMGCFLLRVNYDTKNSEDMDEMIRVLRDPEAEATVESYDEDNVTLNIHPGW